MDRVGKGRAGQSHSAGRPPCDAHAHFNCLLFLPHYEMTHSAQMTKVPSHVSEGQVKSAQGKRSMNGREDKGVKIVNEQSKTMCRYLVINAKSKGI